VGGGTKLTKHCRIVLVGEVERQRDPLFIGGLSPISESALRRVKVDNQDTGVLRGNGRQVHDDSALADAALLVEHSNDAHLILQLATASS